MPSSFSCLVWDFFRPFSGSDQYKGHIMPLWVRQNTCQEWSRLITVPVKVGGPLVTQCSTPIFSLMLCLEEEALKRACSIIHVLQHHIYFPPPSSYYFLWGCLKCCALSLLIVCAYVCGCRNVCGMGVRPLYSHNATTKVDDLGHHVTHSGVRLARKGHTERCVCVCVRLWMCVRRLECRFHTLPDNEIKNVPSTGGIPVIPLPVIDFCWAGAEQVCISTALFSVQFSWFPINPDICEVWIIIF